MKSDLFILGKYTDLHGEHRYNELAVKYAATTYRFQRYQPDAPRLQIFPRDLYPDALMEWMERQGFIRWVDLAWLAQYGYGKSDITKER